MKGRIPRMVAIGFLLCLASTTISCYALEQVEAADAIDKTYIRVDAAVASSVYPSLGTNGMREYSPDKALTKGSGYWSSEGSHKNEVVSWTGMLSNRRTVDGVNINWAYAPGKVSLVVSFDGKEPFQEVVPFQDTNAPSAAFEQQITFPHPTRVKAIRILMKDARYEYFGINLVQLIGAGHPMLRIHGGITSPHQDMCLQIDEHDDVVLDGCLASLTAMDGRALWKYNELGQLYNPIRNKCMVLRDNIDLDGGAIVAQDCEQSYKYSDGRSIWELQPNNQLKLLKGGSFCLSQQGSKAGMTNVAKDKQAKASHPRPGDISHGPGFAVDGHSETYWASQSFPANAVPAEVFFDIDLGGKYKLNTAAIDWEYPAMSYSISISDDGKTFTPSTSNHVNSLYSTLDDLKSRVGRYVRLTLEKPHPVHGRIDDDLLYGIREFAIYSNRLRSTVQSCGIAKNSSDARDKYFLELVAEVDFTSGNELHNANQAVATASAELALHETELDAATPMLVTCKADKEQAKQKLASLEAKYGTLSDQFAALENSLRAAARLFGPSSTSSLTPGYSEASPVTDCYILKNSMPQVISGFYYVAPNCAPKVLRAYCDSEYGGTYFVPPDNDGLIEPLDSVRACAAYGLEPIHLHSTNQLASLHRMLKLMGVDLNNPVPLGISNGHGSFYSLDMKKDITAYVMGANVREDKGLNTVGLGGDGLVFFDSSDIEMSAIICSTNQDALNPPPAYMDISCATPPGGNAAFDGPPGTSLTVKCPQNCMFTAEGALVVGGEEGIYSDDSSICLAAIHAGVIDRSALIRVHMVQAPNELEGSENNGVTSESYSGPRAARAFRLESVAVKCPHATQETESSSSFLEVDAIRDESSLGSDERMKGANPVAFVQQIATVDDSMTAGTQAAVRQLEVLVNSRVGSISSGVITMVEAEANKIISEARGILKPAGVLEEELRARAGRLLSKAMTLAESLKAAAGRVTSTLERTNHQLQQVSLTRASQTEADSWELTAFHPVEFYDVFEVFNSKTAIGAGNWKVGDAPAGGRGGRSILSQTAVVAPANPGVAAVGTYASVRDKRFFDGVFSADVYVSGSGSVGIGFRMKDFENMFLFEMRQSNGGFKRLLRIVNGTPIEVARVEDGGYLEGKWYTVRIDMREARLRISVVEESTAPAVVDPQAIIDLIDGSFMSGSIGFFTSGVDGAYFDMVRVDALPCVLRDAALPPKPATCSNYREMFFGSLRKNWSVSELDRTGGPARWEYRTNVGGEPKVLAQMSSVRGREEHTPSVAVLGGNRGCERGIFSFKILPQCESGIVGAVFKYMDPLNYMLFEMSPTFARLRKRADGLFTTAAKSFLGGYKVGEWNSITITFNGGTVIVNAGRGGSPIPIFSVIGRESWEGGAVGFASWNCGGVAFADITLHPLQENHIVPDPVSSPVSVFTELDTEREAGMQLCLNRKHAFERAEFCNKLQSKGEKAAEKCKTNFCDACCEEELPVSAKARNSCKKQCHKNDGESTTALEALETVKLGCSIEGSKPIYRFCEAETDKHQCHREVCEMCCETAKVTYDQPHRARRFIAQECKNTCSVPAAQQEL